MISVKIFGLMSPPTQNFIKKALQYGRNQAMILDLFSFFYKSVEDEIVDIFQT